MNCITRLTTLQSRSATFKDKPDIFGGSYAEHSTRKLRCLCHRYLMSCWKTGGVQCPAVKTSSMALCFFQRACPKKVYGYITAHLFMAIEWGSINLISRNTHLINELSSSEEELKAEKSTQIILALLKCACVCNLKLDCVCN